MGWGWGGRGDGPRPDRPLLGLSGGIVFWLVGGSIQEADLAGLGGRLLRASVAVMAGASTVNAQVSLLAPSIFCGFQLQPFAPGAIELHGGDFLEVGGDGGRGLDGGGVGRFAGGSVDAMAVGEVGFDQASSLHKSREGDGLVRTRQLALNRRFQFGFKVENQGVVRPARLEGVGDVPEPNRKLSH